MEFERNRLYMIDNGDRVMPVVNVRPCGESGRYVEADHAFEDGLRIVVRASDVRDTTDGEIQKYKWVVNELKKQNKGAVVTAKLKSLEDASYVDPGTGKLERGYRFSTDGGWKYSDVTGPMLRALLERYDIKHVEIASRCGILPKNFRDRYLAKDKKITVKTWEKIERCLCSMLECDKTVIKRDLSVIRGKIA